MKRTISAALLVTFICGICLPSGAQVMWRGAKTMKQGSVIAMAEWYFMDYTKVWDSTNDEWIDNPSDYTVWGFQTMFGYAPMERLEVMAHVPFTFKSLKTTSLDESSSGIGDMILKARYGLLPWAKDQHGLTLVGSLRLPTGSDDETISACNLGDGTTDIGLAGIFSSAWMNANRGHVKLNYWINGKNDDDTDIGDELKLILKYDRNFSKKAMGFATFIYYSKGDTEDSNGNVIANKDRLRYSLVLGGVYKPKPGIFVRPKVSLPLGGEKGSNFDFKPLLDLWYVFAL